MLSLNCKHVQHVKICLPCNFEVNHITHFGVISLFESNFQNFNTFRPLFKKNYKRQMVSWNCKHVQHPITHFDRLCKIEKRGNEIKKNLLLWNYRANLNQNLLKWTLGGPLSNLCPSAPSCIQDGCHY